MWNHSGKLVGKGYSAWFKYYSLHYLEKILCVLFGWELLTLKLKEDWCGITQEGWLENVILHGLNIIVSFIWENLV